jgi:hypothetical protein
MTLMLFFHPLGMGVPVVFHHVADQPHTSSSHFASFPHGLPDHRFMLQFVLPAHPQDHEPSISSTISLPICEPIFISPTSYRNSPMGPPPFICFHRHFCPTWGTHFTLGHPFLYFVHLSQIYSLFIVQTPYFPVISTSLLCRHRWRPSFLFGHTQPMSPLVGAVLLISPLPTSSISSEYPQVTYHLPSEFVHLVPPLAQLSPGLVVPLTLDLVTRLRPLFLSYILQPRAVLSHPTF